MSCHANAGTGGPASCHGRHRINLSLLKSLIFFQLLLSTTVHDLPYHATTVSEVCYFEIISSYLPRISSLLAFNKVAPRLDPSRTTAVAVQHVTAIYRGYLSYFSASELSSSTARLDLTKGFSPSLVSPAISLLWKTRTKS